MAPFLTRTRRLYRWLAFPRRPTPPGLILFSERIRERHRRWIEEDTPGVHTLRACRTQRVHSTDSPETWKCCPYWQRKLSDKLNAKEFAAHYGVAVPKVLWKGKDPADLLEASLPSRYAIKTSIGWSSKQVMLISDGVNLIDGKRNTLESIVDRYRDLMSRPPHDEGFVLVEELLAANRENERLPDYKMFVFGGRVECIEHIDRNRLTLNRYGPAWDQREPLAADFPKGPVVPPPRHLDELIAAAETLGRAYETFVRVDLYDTSHGVVFGELTPFPAKGFGFSDLPNQELGRAWTEAYPRSDY